MHSVEFTSCFCIAACTLVAHGYMQAKLQSLNQHASYRASSSLLMLGWSAHFILLLWCPKVKSWAGC